MQQSPMLLASFAKACYRLTSMRRLHRFSKCESQRGATAPLAWLHLLSVVR